MIVANSLNNNTPAAGFSRGEVEENHRVFMQRLALYREFGFDQEQARRNIMLQFTEKSGSVLEIGTGKGHLTTVLAQSFDRVVTVDIDPAGQRIAMLNAAYLDMLGKIDFLTADAARLPFPDRSFDTVVSAFTFHHLELPFKIIREMTRLARRQVLISDFNQNGFDIIDTIHAAEGRTHERMASDFSIVGFYLREFGFTVEEFQDDWQILFSARRSEI